jgi:hypothetical protein
MRRNPITASIALVGFIWITCLLLNPTYVPTLVRGLDIWVRTHFAVFLWVILALIIVDSVAFLARFQTQTNKRLEALEKQAAELKRNPNA